MPKSDWDEVDKGCASILKTAWGILLIGISSFGWCWLITWITNFRGLQDMGSPLGGNEPFVAGAIAIIPLLIFGYISGQINNA